MDVAGHRSAINEDKDFGDCNNGNSDTMNAEEFTNEEKPEGAENESVEQLAFADRIILNKCGLLSPELSQRLRKKSNVGMSQLVML